MPRHLLFVLAVAVPGKEVDPDDVLCGFPCLHGRNVDVAASDGGFPH